MSLADDKVLEYFKPFVLCFDMESQTMVALTIGI